ncbi:phospholipase D-like domain-containing protein [Paracoccaceae bacterium Fryx2]|nr:phospholipase D-like domain-containing protein [Paracoccaceae bacterium Fryx2]
MKTMSDLLEPGRNCWRLENADRFSVIIDAEQYFLAARDAMLQAKKSIILVGWDFDARIHLGRSESDRNAPDTLGDLVLWLVEREPRLEIRLLQWNSGRFRNLVRGTNAWYLMRWKMHDRITARLDGIHPPLASHHQKLLVVDDSLAFCGGIDMTMKRWDTRAHADAEPGRTSPSGKQLQPWHDLTSIFDADAAKAMGDLCRLRWKRACGEVLEPVADGKVNWPENILPLVGPARIGIARSQPEMEDQDPVREIEALHIDMIAAAKTLIYAESQYFASRRIAAALARRLEEPDGPEVVIVNPAEAEGWLEPLAMDTARARLVASLMRHDPHGRLAIYHPVTAGENPIYVHAKLLIVDDRLLRIGSSNFNNRSMRLDSECDVVLDATQDGSGAIAGKLRDLLHDLLAEHLGRTPEAVAASVAREGSLVRGIEALRGSGRSLVPYEIPDLSALQAWLADNEILDPDGPEEVFETIGKRGLFRGRLRKPGH